MTRQRRVSWPLALMLAAAGPLPAAHAQGQNAPAPDPAQWRACLASLPGTRAFRAIDPTTFSVYTQALQPDPSVLALLDRQPEFTLPPWDYLAQLVDAERVQDGRAALAHWRDTLAAIEEKTGVPAAIVVAVWGVESNFGRNLGKRPLVQSLATLSCFGRRQAYFRGEFAAALRILQEGHIAAEQLNGSWAGAFGQTQFMPSTFFQSAVDFDGDGRRDIVASVPDALASTARFLQNAGWQRSEPWGLEVKLPSGFDSASASRKNKQAMTVWRRAGLARVDGSPLPAAPPKAGLLVPAKDQGGGPAFLVGRNFDALFRYNASENYALAIAHLGDLIAGPEPAASLAFATPWPTDDLGLSRAENRELQALLVARGHDIGPADGLIGAQTRAAIRLEQQRLEMKVDGRAGQKLLAALRQRP